MDNRRFIVEFDPGGGDPIRYVSDMITPTRGNPLMESFPEFTADKSKAFRMTRVEAEDLASLLSFDGETKILEEPHA